jgi:hypothetical protein
MARQSVNRLAFELLDGVVVKPDDERSASHLCVAVQKFGI